MKVCKKCSVKNNDKANFCTACGSDEFLPEAKSNNKSLLIGVIIGVVIAVAAFAAIGGQGDDGDKYSESTRYTFNYETGTSNVTTTEKPAPSQSFVTTTTTTTTQRYTQPAENTYPISLRLTSDLQYTMNLFLSNFSEARLKSFDGFPEVEEAVHFALNFNFINKNERFEKCSPEVLVNGKYYNLRIKQADVYDTVLNYFNVASLVPDFGQNLPNYKDGYFYYVFTGGMVMGDLAIATAVRQTDRYYYEVDFNLYFTDGKNRNMYTMNDSQVQAEKTSNQYISYAGSGTAVISSTDIYRHNACRLESYRLY